MLVFFSVPLFVFFSFFSPTFICSSLILPPPPTPLPTRPLSLSLFFFFSLKSPLSSDFLQLGTQQKHWSWPPRIIQQPGETYATMTHQQWRSTQGRAENDTPWDKRSSPMGTAPKTEPAPWHLASTDPRHDPTILGLPTGNQRPPSLFPAPCLVHPPSDHSATTPASNNLTLKAPTLRWLIPPVPISMATIKKGWKVYMYSPTLKLLPRRMASWLSRSKTRQIT